MFPRDPATYALDMQFMLGDALMGIPIVDEGAGSVDGYLPNQVALSRQSAQSVQCRCVRADRSAVESSWLTQCSPRRLCLCCAAVLMCAV